MNKNRVNVAVVVVLGAAALLLGVKGFSGGGGGGGSYNVLLITLDTTRADHVGCYGYEAALTPALDKLAVKGVVFDQAFCDVPMTLPSHTTILTGLHPPEHGLRINGEHRLDLSDPTLAEILQKEGYQTGAFIASVALDSQNGLDRGFDIYEDDMSAAYEHGEGDLSAYRPGDVVTDSALAWLEKRNEDQPFFCWVHLYDPHTPYYHHAALAGTRYQNWVSYDAEIAFMDMQVARVMAFLEEEGLTENTLVVAVGDHGEGLDEHGEPTHGYMLYETTLCVPLIFSQPGRLPEGLRVGAMVSLVDLFATIQDLLGLDDVEERSGRSIAAAVVGHEIDSVPCYGETFAPFTTGHWSPLWSLTTPQWKYIRSRRVHLYDRQADKKELTNLASGRPDIVEQLEEQLKEIEGEMTLHAAEQVKQTAETIERLAALGYISGGPTDFDAEGLDYSRLRDVEDMLPVINQLDRMRLLGQQGEYKQQAALLRELIELSPETSGFRRFLGLALLNDGKEKEAIPEFQEYLRMKTDDHSTRFNLGLLCANQKDYVEAVRQISMVIRSSPEASNTHEAMAKILRDHGDHDGAARHSQGLWAMDAEAVEQYDLGIVLSGQKKFEEAVKHFKKALEIAPHDPLTHRGLASALERMGDLAGASRHYSEALRLEPDTAQNLSKLGTALGKQGKFEEAVKYLSKALEIEPENTVAINNLGLVLGQQGKFAEAIECFRKVLKVQPDNTLALRNLGDVYQRQGKLAEAAQQYAEAIRIDPEDAPSHKGLGIVLGRQGKFDEALEQFSEVLRIDPKNGQAHFLKGGMFQAQKKITEAIAEYREALRLSPKQPAAANSLAWILATHHDPELRDGEEAIKLAELACEVTKYKASSMLDSLAAAYAEAGRFEEAVATARKALGLSTGPHEQKLVKEIQARLKLYEADRAYHAEP